MNWDNYRREDRSINLAAAWASTVVKPLTQGQKVFVESFLSKVEERHPIRSRQVASLCIAQANALAMMCDPDFDDAFKY